MFSTSLVLTSLLSTALATPLSLSTRSTLPDVTIKALSAGCASYPQYNAETQTAGPWSMIVAAAENPSLIDVGPGTSYSLAVGPSGPKLVRGYLNLNTRPDYARRVLQCIDQKLNVYTPTSVNAAGAPQTAVWTPLALSPYPYDASLLYLVDGEQPTLYEHYVGEEKQEGWFLGGYNTSTWGAKWYDAQGPSQRLPFYYMRLLPEGQTLGVNETRIHLKIQV